GDPAPGTPNSFVGAFSGSIGANGDVIVTAHTGTNGAIDSYYRLDGAGALQLVAIEGTPAPGLPGYIFSQFPDPANIPAVVNGAGDLFFRASLDDPNVAGAVNLRAIYRADRAGTVEPIIVPGDPIPGGGALLTPSEVVHANDAGQVLFTTGGPAPVTVWLWD